MESLGVFWERHDEGIAVLQMKMAVGKKFMQDSALLHGSIY